MSNRRVLFGFGGCRIQFRQDEQADFPFGSGVVSYTPKVEIKENRFGKKIQYFSGWEVKVSIEVHNVDYNSSLQFAALASLLGRASQHPNEPIIIYPRFDYVRESGLSYEVLLPDVFSPEDTGKVAASQTLRMSFDCVELATAPPAYLSDQEAYRWSDGAGNIIVDEDSAKIILIG